MGKPRYSAQDFIDAIPTSGGIIATIAKRVGCDWTTAKIWITERPTVRRAYEDECEAVSDMAESVLLKRIQEGDEATAKWWLSRIRRGKFSERHELGGSLSVKLSDIVSMSDEELDEFIDGNQ